MSNIDFLLPGIAAEILKCDICMRCSNSSITPDGKMEYDLDICHGGKCPLIKFREAIGFTFDSVYSYPAGTEEIKINVG